MKLTFKQFLIEARYARHYKDAREVYERYVDFFEHDKKRQYGELTIIDYDYNDSFDAHWATIYCWVTNKTQAAAEQYTKDFADNHNLPYTGVDSDIGTPSSDSFVHSRVHATIFFKEDK